MSEDQAEASDRSETENLRTFRLVRLAEQIATANFHQVEAKVQKDCELMKAYLVEKQEHSNRQARP